MVYRIIIEQQLGYHCSSLFRVSQQFLESKTFFFIDSLSSVFNFIFLIYQIILLQYEAKNMFEFTKLKYFHQEIIEFVDGMKISGDFWFYS